LLSDTVQKVQLNMESMLYSLFFAKFGPLSLTTKLAAVSKSNVKIIFGHIGINLGQDLQIFTRTIDTWGRCYDHNFLQFFTIFGEKIGVFSKTNVMIKLLPILALF
jgi:hypothetical protein